MKRPRLFSLTMAGIALAGAMYLSGVLSAQSLATPNFTTAQAAQGERPTNEPARRATAPISTTASSRRRSRRGVPVALRRQAARRLHEDVLRMPPTAPNSLDDAVRAQILAYLAQENGVTATNRELSHDAAALRGAAIPGAAGGPSGGLTTGVPIPPPPRGSIRWIGSPPSPTACSRAPPTATG
jgi:hypothetical protein